MDLIVFIIYRFGRIGAALAMRVENVVPHGKGRYHVRCVACYLSSSGRERTDSFPESTLRNCHFAELHQGGGHPSFTVLMDERPSATR